MDEIFRIIGQINFTLSRISFVASNLLFQLGLEGNIGAFFAVQNTKDKFSKLPSRLSKVVKNESLINELSDWIEELKISIEYRNHLTHSLTLNSIENPDSIKLLNYRTIDKRTNPEVKVLDICEIRNFNEDFIILHNKGVEIFDRIEKVCAHLVLIDSAYLSGRFSEIESNLKSEFEKSKFGAYVHITEIRKAYNLNKVIVGIYYDEIIGFAFYHVFEGVCNLYQLWINEEKRNNGYGSLFIRKFIHLIKARGCFAITLKCSPIESANFWEQTGFKRVENVDIRYNSFDYYLPLTNIQIPNGNKSKESIKVEIWDKLPHNVGHKKAKWVLDKENSKILIPVDFEWNIRITKADKSVISGCLKCFDSENHRILFGNLLYIADIKEFVNNV